MEWTKLNTLIASVELQKLMDKIYINSLNGVYLAEENGIKYYIIIANNGWYFKPHCQIAVNFIVEGKEMPQNHSHFYFRNEYSENNIYLSNVFCVFDNEEKRDRIEYIKEKALELSQS